MNLFKKYFDEKEAIPENDPKKSPIADENLNNHEVADDDTLNGFLQKRLEEEFEEFAKQILEEEFDTSNLQEFLFETKNKSSKQIKIVPANQLKAPKLIPTGSPNFDKLLEGGIPSKSLIEVFGPPGTGKTQLLFQLAACSTLNGKTIFIDTEGTFSPPRIKMILGRFSDVELDEALNKILVIKVTDFKEQLASVELVAEKLSKEENVNMILIDSISNLFRARLWGDKLLKIRQQLLNFHLFELRKLAEEFDLAVVYSNQVTASFDGLEGSINPVGGNITGHNANVRLQLKKGQNGYYEASIISSSYLAPKVIKYNITSQGVI